MLAGCLSLLLAVLLTVLLTLLLARCSSRSALVRVVIALGAVLVPSSLLGGPHLGGTLVVHDCGLAYTDGVVVYPTLAPESCATMDAEAPVETPHDGSGHVWKVYAVFPEGSRPRLKALAFAATWDPRTIHLLDGGPPDPWRDFEVPMDGWLARSGEGTGVSFAATRTSLVSEVYWVAGYASAPARWYLAAHPQQPGTFVDDAVPRAEDAIHAYGSIGFGLGGEVPCPVVLGACCLPDGICRLERREACLAEGGVGWGAFAPCAPDPCASVVGGCCLDDGSCLVVDGIACLERGGVHQGRDVPCAPHPCPAPPGACCHPDGFCDLQSAPRCREAGGEHRGDFTRCDPNPCPYPTAQGACCLNGQCIMLDLDRCHAIRGSFLGDGASCVPQPCPIPPVLGACCFASGACRMGSGDDCGAQGGYYLGDSSDCWPNPCAQPAGACCLSQGGCLVAPRVECSVAGGVFLGEATRCEPDPCLDLTGACCYADGSCRLVSMLHCAGVYVPIPACEPGTCAEELGACCFYGGSCLVLREPDCLANGGFAWWQGIDCTPNPCDSALPVERMSWGRLKESFRSTGPIRGPVSD